MAHRIKLTDRAIGALPAPRSGERAEYADTETTGLRLRVSSSGIKTFSLLRRTKNGPMERLTLGRWGDIKCEEARRKAKTLTGLIVGGANPAAVNRANKGEPTFADLFDEYLERHSKVHKRTWSADAAYYRDYLAGPLGKKKVSKITRQDLATIHSAITKSGHPGVANRVKATVSSIFSKAIVWGYLDENPAKGIANNPARSRDRFLKPGELPRLFAALAEEFNTNFRDFFMLLLLTGARRENVVSMRWVDLDLDRAEWRIPDTKNGEPHRVPLMPEAVTIIKARRDVARSDERFVFPAARSDSKYGYMGGERKAWLRLLDRDEATQLRQRIESSGASVEKLPVDTVARALSRMRMLAKRLKINTDDARMLDIRMHDLRRTMGSWQARTGASLLVIGKSLGHKSQQATAIYARLDLDPVRAAMETATAAMLRAAKKQSAVDVLPYKKRA